MSFNVGDRIISGGQAGTVRYVGPLGKRSETWLGVQWDDPSKGKHNGTYEVLKNNIEGKQYFDSPGTSGSFIKMSDKVQGAEKFSEVLRSKYIQQNEVTEELFLLSTSEQRVKVEFPGEAEVASTQQQTATLPYVELSSSCIGDLDKPEVFPSPDPQLILGVQELNLSHNLLSSWPAVLAFCARLPQLTTLNVSGNRFSAFPVAPAPLPLKVLVLNATDFPTAELGLLSQAFPNLEELHLFSNNIENLPPLDGLFPNLVMLNLDKNRLAWPLLSHPKLQKLNLADNRITEIHRPPPGAFPALRSLILSSNELTSWDAVQALDGLGLQELKLQLTPLAQVGPIKTRLLALARLPSLTSFNGSSVRPREREDAEKWYLREIVEEVAEEAERAQRHPRYPSLLKAYGPLERNPTVDAGPALLELDLVHLDKTVKKRIPRTLAIDKLQLLVRKLFGVPEADQILSYEAGSGHLPQLLDDLGRPISYYVSQSAGLIRVQEK